MAQSVLARPPAFRIRWAVMMTNFFCLGLNYADRAAIGLAAPFIIAEFHFSKAAFGLILSVFYFGYAPFNWIGGWLSDRYGPRSVFGFAILWWSIFTGLTAVGFNFVSFMLIRWAFGFGEGPQAVVTAKTMANWFPQREVGRSFGIANSSTNLGSAVAAPIMVGILLATNNNWRICFIVLGIVGALFTIGWFVVVRSTPEDHPWISKAEQEEIISGQPQRVAATEDPNIPSMWRYIREPLVITNAIAFFGYAWVLYTFTSWFPVYLLDARHIQLADLAWAAAIPWLGGFVGFLLGGFAGDYLAKLTGNAPGSRKGIIVVCLLLAAGFMALATSANSIGAAVVLMSAVVLFMQATGPQYFGMVADLVPSIRYGGVCGFIHLIANISGVAAPFFVGLIVDQTGSWPLTFGIAAGICAVCALGLLLFGRFDRLRALAAGVGGGAVTAVPVAK